MQSEQLVKHLTEREHELERARTRALARQQWGTTIELDARIAECERLRKWLATQEEKTEVKP